MRNLIPEGMEQAVRASSITAMAAITAELAGDGASST